MVAPNMSRMRTWAGALLALGATAAYAAVVLQQPFGTPISSQLDAVSEHRSAEFAALGLWVAAASLLLTGCFLVAHVLRGPRSGLAVVGCAMLGIGVLQYFGVRLFLGALRYALSGPRFERADATRVLDVFATGISSQAVLFVLLPLFILGGSLLGLGLARAGISHSLVAALWALSSIGYVLVAGTRWAEILTFGGLALALLMMGIHIAKFRPILVAPTVTAASPTIS